MTRCRCCFLFVSILSGFAVADAASAQDLAGQRVMTVDWDVALKVKHTIVHTAPLGEVYFVGQQQGDWLWIPSHRGWIQRSSVVPYDQAIAHFDQKVQATPTAINYYHRGLAWQATGELDRAIADYGKAIDLAPEVAAYYVIRGNARNDKGEHDKAIVDYDEAIRLEPSGAAYHGRGDASFEKGDLEQAIVDYGKAIEADPEFTIALNNRGTALMKQGQLEAAIADYDQVLRLDPTFAAALGNRGRAKAQLGHDDEARADFSKAIELNPDDHWPYNDLAWALATSANPQSDDGQKAVENATRACELTEWENSTTLTTLAAAYAQAGDFDSAVQSINKAMTIDERDRDKRGKMLAYFQQQKPYRE